MSDPSVENLVENKPSVITQREDDVAIDGDKVIAFITAIESLGKMMNALNIIAVKEAFLLHQKCEWVDSVIECQKKWEKALQEMADGLHKNADLHEKLKDDYKELIAFVRNFSNVASTPQFKDSCDRLEKMVALLDRLEKHKQSGLLEVVAKL